MTFEEAVQKAHVAKLRNGDRYIIVKYDNELKLVTENGFNSPYLIDKGGEYILDEYHDIVELYTIPCNEVSCIGDLLHKSGELIWKEDSPIFEVSMQEIANKFGVPVKHIRIKE